MGDFVWYDVNGDGAQGVDEIGLDGLTVTITADLDGDGTSDFNATTVTGDNPDTAEVESGWYAFDNRITSYNVCYTKLLRTP